MPNPRVPNGFKPVIQGYGFGAPDGVMMTEVGGGMPRGGLEWDRGVQQFQVSRVMKADEFAVWTAFFHHVIKKGALPFILPLDSGFGMQDHDCLMVPGSYSARRVGGQITSISFTVVAESAAYAMTSADGAALVEIWNEYGSGSDDLLERIAQFANVDTLVLQE